MIQIPRTSKALLVALVALVATLHLLTLPHAYAAAPSPKLLRTHAHDHDHRTTSIQRMEAASTDGSHGNAMHTLVDIEWLEVAIGEELKDGRVAGRAAGSASAANIIHIGGPGSGAGMGRRASRSKVRFKQLSQMLLNCNDS